MFLIGDCHGKFDEYKELIKDHPSSVQLGDFGFDYSCLSDVRSCHKMIYGNHDDPIELKKHRHCLGDFGLGYNGGREFFFVGGAFSIDRWSRVEGRDWFKEEELNFEQASDCIDMYAGIRQPDIFLSHDCPQVVVDALWGYEPTYTRKLLDTLFRIHKPKYWVFGHHHKSVKFVYCGCTFICLNELETLEL